MGAPLPLLIDDGIVEEFVGRSLAAAQSKKAKAVTQRGVSTDTGVKTLKASELVRLTAEGEALAGRIREWRAAEAKRLRVPAYLVMHDRTVTALALARPRNPRELLGIDGIGPAKVERFGEELLRLCAGK
jgi:superfamily II DNA helicase RecQ